jgi:hypothetical protein
MIIGGFSAYSGVVDWAKMREIADSIGAYLFVDMAHVAGLEVLDAWGKAYGVLANVFINREAEIYNENASKAGGWEGTRDFRIVAKTPRSALITSFELEPVDGGAVAEYRPGQ